GPLTLLRFMRRHRMLNREYAVLILRLAAWKLRLRGRLEAERPALIRPPRRLNPAGLPFIGPGCRLEVGPNAVLELGRWSWLGHGCKIRCHEGRVSLGAKRGMGQEGTVPGDQRSSMGGGGG